MFYSVKFNRFNGYRSSRSELQISMDVICRVPLFKVSLKFKSRDFRCVLVMINAARFIETSCFGVHPYLWHLQRGLFLDTHEPMWRMRDMFLRIESSLVKFINANIDQFFVLKGVSSRVSSAQATRLWPWIWWERSARRNSWTCWWTGASWLRWASSTGVAQGCQLHSTSTDITWWNFWCLWGWKPWKWREIVIFVRTGGCLCSECWTNLKSVYTVPNHPRKSPANKWA